MEDSCLPLDLSPQWESGNSGSDIGEGSSNRNKADHLSGQRKPQGERLVIYPCCNLFIGVDTRVCRPQLEWVSHPTAIKVISTVLQVRLPTQVILICSKLILKLTTISHSFASSVFFFLRTEHKIWKGGKSK